MALSYTYPVNYKSIYTYHQTSLLCKVKRQKLSIDFTYVDPMLLYCLASVEYGGPTLNQHRAVKETVTPTMSSLRSNRPSHHSHCLTSFVTFARVFYHILQFFCISISAVVVVVVVILTQYLTGEVCHLWTRVQGLHALIRNCEVIVLYLYILTIFNINDCT